MNASTLRLGTPFRRKDTPKDAARAERGEAAVRATDTDALLSRISAVEKGYIAPDVYARLFVRGPPPSPRPLLINIGTALRSSEVDSRVQLFLEHGTWQGPSEHRSTGVQILSLGAGSDTRFWRLQPHPAHLQRYIELDFSTITAQKAEAIRAHPSLHAPVGEVAEAATEIHTPCYTLLAGDLHTLGHSTTELARVLALLDPALPTLVLWECVLAYVQPEAADALMTRLAQHLPHLAFLSYDMCIGGDRAEMGAPPDRFGRMMLQNLGARGLTLPGAQAYTTPAAYARRFRSVLGDGATVDAGAYSLCHVWHTLDAAARRRLSRLEGLDEVEELEMLLGHYCMSWAERTRAG